jgi:prepilin-type N-terminal cleavage/methylation domain-containing protein
MLDAIRHRQRKASDQGAPKRLRGLTLIELVVTVAIMAILLVLGVPSFNDFMARGRLIGAAESLTQDLQLARSEALRSNAAVTLSLSAGNAWCYGSVPGGTACNCNIANECTLRRADSADYRGVVMSAPTFAGNAVTFTAQPGPLNAGEVEFTQANIGTLRVRLGAGGQVSVCSTLGALSHLPAC